jgi:hypothetical protein
MVSRTGAVQLNDQDVRTRGREVQAGRAHGACKARGLAQRFAVNGDLVVSVVSE